MLESILQKWRASFGDPPPQVIVRAPGRVNIIGEHTDYNDGWVLPGAMSRCLFILISHNDGSGHHWIASDLGQEFLSPEYVVEYGEYSWARYIQGAISLYAPEIGPLKILIGGDLPVGAGISSSSALVCGILYAIQQLTGRHESKEELALLGRRVEREIIGVQGGIMDQFAIMMSEPNHVMLLDCRTRHYRNISADLPGCRWILINTKVKHALIDSDYNQRSAQCEQAVGIIQKTYPDITALRDVTLEMLRSINMSDVLMSRSSFVIEENNRVHAMIRALELHDVIAAGKLLKASHEGLRDKYEVSCAELDHIADFANRFTGVLGARMMGGGFGGCVICLLKTDVLDAFSTGCSDSYTKKFGFAPEIIQFELAGGVQQLH